MIRRAYPLPVVLFILPFVIFNSCHDQPIPPDDTVKPGRRDYTWSIDTLMSPGSFQVSLRDIWGSSASNIWVVGRSENNAGQIFRLFDSQWISVRVSSSSGGNIEGFLDLNRIFGFGPSDIWVVGKKPHDNPAPPPIFIDSALILHYDGNSWSERIIPSASIMTCVWGSAPNSVWFGGTKGTLFHYDGTSFVHYPIDSTISLIHMFGFSEQNIYATGHRLINSTPPEDSSEFIFLQFSNNSWQIVDSFIVYPGYEGDEFGYSRLWGMSPNELFSVSHKVFQLRGGGWAPIHGNTLPFYGISGTSIKNIIAVGSYNQINHFNGNDWAYLTPLDQSKYAGSVWCDNNEVFVVSSDGQYSYVYHGQ